MKRMMLICMSISLCMMNVVHAEQKSMKKILVTSSDLPYLYIIEPLAQQEMNVLVVPADLYVSNVSFQELSDDALLSQIKDYLHLEYTNTVHVDLDTLDEDFHTDKNSFDLHTMKGLTSYFEHVKKEIKISDILHYQRYINSDLSLSDYYDFYQMFQTKVTIHYMYLPYFSIDEISIPLSSSFSS